jgi:hypothetical protein
MTKANPYEYAGDNPVNATDPSGRCSTIDLVFLIVAAVALGGLAVIALVAIGPGIAAILAPVVAGGALTGEIIAAIAGIIFGTSGGWTAIFSVLGAGASAGLVGTCWASL